MKLLTLLAISVYAAEIKGAAEVTDVGKAVASYIVILLFGALGGILF